MSATSSEIPRLAGVGGAPAGPTLLGLPRDLVVAAGVLLALLVAIYHNNLIRIWVKTNPISGEDYWGHAIIVPIIGLYYLFTVRDELARTPIRPLLGLDFNATRWISSGAVVAVGTLGYFVFGAIGGTVAAYFSTLSFGLAVLGLLAVLMDWGLALMIGGLALSIYGIYPGQNDFVWDVGGVVTLGGAVLTLFGWGVMKIVWFPIAFLLCAIPWPGMLYSQVAMPLQQIAAQAAVFTLQLSGVESQYEGTRIFMMASSETGGREWRTLNVAEACAGLRSLMTFISVAAAIAFLSTRPLWQKLFLTATAVPIAIFCNVVRVSGQGLLDFYVSRELSQDFAHQFVGLVMLIPAFFMILLIAWILDQLFIDEPTGPASTAGVNPT